ncbi:hypothetical protein [Treponema phagedenis]|uniref:hypothetical protein n=1 Tax=Treponema phagedenis TaxID=162 RepID=UPI0015A02848|nr:hypothetical protein [Treponema phagedenis]NVP24407.1 hypothetical protein [Treponema phagedenis]QLC59904.1 hypothetical protein HW453_14705 [Treponema phagedenis]
MANPGKEISVRSFLSKMRARPAAIVDTLKQSGDIYLLWSYLCSFIRQEFAKKTEKLPDEVALIQGVFITEYLNNYYRNKAQQNLQRETALKNLELNLQKQPYYFNMNMITNFKDTRGVPLLGQYSEDDLKTYMENQTTEITSGSLPHLLSFQTFDKDRYYVLLEKVIPLIISLTTENRKIIKEQCMQYWYDQMLKFIQTESMKSDEAFEIFLKEICKEQVPHLYALLNSSFIPPLVIEPKLVDTQSVELNRIFPEGKLALYQDLFALKRAKLLTDTRILLPFWYTLPFFSAIVAFFKRIRKPKKNTKLKNPKKKLLK